MLRWKLIIPLLGIALLATGCIEIEPKTGTRVTVDIKTAKPITRPQLAAVSRYLTLRGGLLLGVNGPRVASVSDYSITLLLPGKKVPKKEVDRLIEPYSIELYHLSSVATEKNPNRAWTMRAPSKAGGSYLFSGPDAAYIDSRLDPKALLAEVVDTAHNKPVLTGRDILPVSTFQRASEGFSVLVKFTDAGKKKFYQFTKDNPGEYLAVFYNGRLVSAPVIKSAISEGQAYITGFGLEDQARAAAQGINAGTLPVKVEISKVQYY